MLNNTNRNIEIIIINIVNVERPGLEEREDEPEGGKVCTTITWEESQEGSKGGSTGWGATDADTHAAGRGPSQIPDPLETRADDHSHKERSRHADKPSGGFAHDSTCNILRGSEALQMQPRTALGAYGTSHLVRTSWNGLPKQGRGPVLGARGRDTNQ